MVANLKNSKPGEAFCVTLLKTCDGGRIGKVVAEMTNAETGERKREVLPAIQARDWRVERHAAPSLKALGQLLRKHARDGDAIWIQSAPAPHCFQRSTRRQNRYFDLAPSYYFPLDCDGVPSESTEPREVAEVARNLLGPAFRNAACLYQATSSFGLKDAGRIRLVFMLDKPLNVAELKAWTAQIEGAEAVGVDRTLYKATQPIYFSTGFRGCKDHVAERWGELDGVATVAAPEGLAEVVDRDRQEREQQAREGVVEDAPHMLADALRVLKLRSAGKCGEGLDDGRRNNARNAAHDFRDRAISQGVAEAIICAWIFGEDYIAELQDELVAIGFSTAVASDTVADVRTAHNLAAETWASREGDVDFEQIADQVNQAYSHYNSNEFGCAYKVPAGETIADAMRADEDCDNIVNMPKTLREKRNERFHSRLLSALDAFEATVTEGVLDDGIVSDEEAADARAAFDSALDKLPADIVSADLRRKMKRTAYGAQLSAPDDQAETIDLCGKLRKLAAEATKTDVKEVDTRKRGALQSIADFCAGYEPVQYLVDGVLERKKLYTLTAKTGAGKTTLLSSLALAIAAKRDDMLGSDVERGRVVYLTFENPDDFRVKLIAAMEAHGVTVEALGDCFDVIAAHKSVDEIVTLLRKNGGAPIALIVLDTLQAAFVGNDSNSNDEIKKFVMSLRKLISLPGKPSVIVAAHPVKNAAKENLIPYGGGAVLNEIDGNLYLWRDGRKPIIEMHHQGKFRGVDFEPRFFEIEDHTATLVDSKGRALRLPIVRYRSAAEAETKTEKANEASRNEQAAFLVTIKADPKITVTAFGLAHSLNRSAAQRKLEKLEEAKLVVRRDGELKLLRKGESLLREEIEKEDRLGRIMAVVDDEDDDA